MWNSRDCGHRAPYLRVKALKAQRGTSDFPVFAALVAASSTQIQAGIVKNIVMIFLSPALPLQSQPSH